MVASKDRAILEIGIISHGSFVESNFQPNWMQKINLITFFFFCCLSFYFSTIKKKMALFTSRNFNVTRRDRDVTRVFFFSFSLGLCLLRDLAGSSLNLSRHQQIAPIEPGQQQRSHCQPALLNEQPFLSYYKNETRVSDRLPFALGSFGRGGLGIGYGYTRPNQSFPSVKAEDDFFFL